MDFSSLNALDFAVLFIIGTSTLFALFRGFISSVLSLIGWILSIYLTYILYPYLEPILAKKFGSKIAVASMGYGGLFTVLLVGFAILNTIISSSVSMLSMGFINSTLGGVFGFLRGFLIVSFFYLCISKAISIAGGTDSKDEKKVGPEWLIKAQTYDFLRLGKGILVSITSDSFDKGLDNLYGSISEKTKDQRFIAYAITELNKHTPEEQKKKIEEENTKNALTKSDEELEMDTLKSLLDAYQHQSHPDEKSTLNADDIKRLEVIIKNFSVTQKESADNDKKQ